MIQLLEVILQKVMHANARLGQLIANARGIRDALISLRNTQGVSPEVQDKVNTIIANVDATIEQTNTAIDETTLL